MSSLFRSAFGLALCAACWLSGSVQAQKGTPALPDILRSAGDYLVQYSQRLQAVVAQEEYLQMDTGGGQINHTRRLSADVVLVGLGRGLVAMYRDTYAIDTKPLHDRSDRLRKLFEEPPGPPVGPLQYAQRFTEESVRAYVTSNLHALDSPFVPLDLVRAENQQRLTFKLDGVKTTDGAQVAVLKFTERGAPSLVLTPADVPVSGRLWIDVASGAVRQTEVIVSNKQINLRGSVVYALDKGLGLWLPAELAQTFEMSSTGAGGSGGINLHESFEGHAKYSKYQQVPIDLSKIR